MLTTWHLWFLSYTHSHTFGSLWAVFACCCLSWVLVSSLESRIWMILEQLSDHSALALTGRGSDSKNWGSKACLRLELNPCMLLFLWFFSTADVLQTFGPFSCCRQQCWCHWSCRLFSVYVLRSLCCPSVVSNQKQNNSQLNNQSEHHSPHSTSTLNLFKLDETMKLRDSNQQFTNCLSSSSCLCSQSASERTMVSWHSEEEEASPLLEVVAPEERGVSGIRVSSSILRSCCDETDSFLVAPKHFLHIFYLGT